MNKKKILLTLAVFYLFSTNLYAEAVFNVNQPIKTLQLTKIQVLKAIKDAADTLDWQVKEKSSNTIIATYRGDIYLAKIKISYRSNGYSIKYFDSKRMHYEKGDIHPTYNILIQKLQNKIVYNLKSIDTSKVESPNIVQQTVPMTSTKYADTLRNKLNALKILLVDNVLTQDEYDLKRKQVIENY